jgi:hypothetical protein
MMETIVRKLFRPVLDRSVTADVWRNTLSRIPTIFGRLNYLAGLRDPNTGRYRHHGLELVYGRVDSNKALRQSHADAFAEWIKLGLPGQHADLLLYLSDLDEDRRSVMATWLQLKHYETLVPGSILGLERRLYIADLVALIQLLKNEPAVSGPNPDASQLP